MPLTRKECSVRESLVLRLCRNYRIFLTGSNKGLLSSSEPRIRKGLVCFNNSIQCLLLDYQSAPNGCVQALKLLRQHKVVEASLSKREGALDNLQNILHQIQMAETDAMVSLVLPSKP